MKQLRTLGGRAAQANFLPSARKWFSLFALVMILGMATWMLSLSPPAFGQSECLLDCQQQYHACLNQPHPPTWCEDAYTACADGCIGW